MAKTYQTLVFRLRALTNLHPGAGDSFYGPVDKTVQRDPATNLPTIYSQSLKGALREYFEEEVGASADFIKRVFGSPVSEKNPNDTSPGAYRFFGADLVALPVPEDNTDIVASFRRVHSGDNTKRIADKIKLLGGPSWAHLDANALHQALAAHLGNFAEETANFKEAAEELPVVARNQLDNGKSENLWYEELVPSESIFVFVVQADSNEQHLEYFKAQLANKIIQVGANASVGYGYCELTLLNPPAAS